MGKIAAIDFGLKRIGIAISDANQKMALPLTTITGGLSAVVALLNSRKAEIETIIVGLPLLLNGQKSDMAHLVEKFAQDLEKALGLPVLLVDERLSSKQADKQLQQASYTRKQRTEVLDQMSAAILLESYLYRLHNGS